jgi:hypothetical protein
VVPVKIIVKPRQEEEILASTRKDADPKEVLRSIVAKAECCVDHLCGCSSRC